MKGKRNGLLRNSLFYIVLILSGIGIIASVMEGNGSGSIQISSDKFVSQLKSKKIKSYSIRPADGIYQISGSYRKPQKNNTNNTGLFAGSSSVDNKVSYFNTKVLENDAIVSDVNKASKTNKVKVTTKTEASDGFWAQLIVSGLPLLIFIVFFYMMMGQAGQGGGSKMMSIGKSKVKPSDRTKNKVRFSDVAGEEEEKQELVEVVEFLKDPRKFVNLGARIPSGVLLEGPPGTGKTLLAKAVAGEANVPFYSMSGSNFVEMFVGVGASRVRDLFEQAKKSAPSIIFIDEIDAVGRKRGNGMGGGHDEREQTLNQLLIELDGFKGNEGVIVIAATNRADVLDLALLRPGRFDRKILVGRPDIRGREAILKVHARNKPMDDNVNLKVLAKQTPGFVGADLENLLNEAALLAARRKKTKIQADDIDEAEDRVIAGPAKKSAVISDKERKTVAYHEAGHTIVGLVLNDARVVHKVTIVPRGRAGGYAIMLPREDQNLMSKRESMEQIAGLMGGRAAEEIIFDQQSSGASNDFEQATELAKAMVTKYGMSEKIGQVALETPDQNYMGQGASYSQQTATVIDDEIRRFTTEGYKEAHKIISEHRDQHKVIAEALLEYETLDEKQILSLFKTGKMEKLEDGNEFPSESGASTFEEAKKSLENKEEQHNVDND